MKKKAWHDDVDAATLQRIKTYSAFNDAESKNLMVQTMYEYREEEIQDFKETNHELALENIKAKKIIRKLIDDIKNYSYLDKLEDIEEAEKFLKVD